MALKSYKPTTPGQRGLVLIDRSELWKGRPVKSLTEGLTGQGGRNNTGRITMRRRGGGAKRLYRVVDFKRRKFDVPAKVIRIEYDPNRTAFIALIGYADGEQAYILAPQRLAVGDSVIAGAKADIKPGMRGAVERAARLGEARAEVKRHAIADEAEAMPGVRATIEGEAVVLEGRRLLDRWLRDASLRTIGRVGA